MVWCQSFPLLPEAGTSAQGFYFIFFFFWVGGMVTIPMVLMLAGFMEGILLPRLYQGPGDHSSVPFFIV